jgi:hypothetical protein
MFAKSFAAALVFLGATGVSGFANVRSTPQSSSTALNMGSEDSAKTVASSFLAAAFLLSNVAFVPPALAMDDMDFGSSQVISRGRSGGRAGGRSSAMRAPSRPSSSPTVIHRTTVIQQPSRVYSSPVMIAPSPVYGGYGYNPLGGLGRFLVRKTWQML